MDAPPARRIDRARPTNARAAPRRALLGFALAAACLAALAMPAAESSAGDTTPPVTFVQLSGSHGFDGWFRSAVTMTLTAQDSQSGVKEIQYRPAGEAARVYSAPVRVESEGVSGYYVRSLDLAGNVEAWRGLNVRVDTQWPFTQVTVGSPSHVGEGGRMFVTNATLVGIVSQDNASGLARTYFENGVYAGPRAFPGPDGIFDVGGHSEDRAGNVEPRHGRVLTRDNTPPTVTVTSPAPGSLSVSTEYVATDSDGDVWPDEVERALGTSPFVETDHPGLDAPALPPEAEGAVESVRYAYVAADARVLVDGVAADPFEGSIGSGLHHTEILLDGERIYYAYDPGIRVHWYAAGTSLGPHTMTVRGVDMLGNTRDVVVPIYVLAPPQDASDLERALAPIVP